jgi:hypothetical protein
MRALAEAIRAKYNFDPNQPRVPAGSGRESGRWTDGGGGAGRLAQAIPPEEERDFEEESPAAGARLDVIRAEADAAIRSVQQIDPSWRQSESLRPNSTDGKITEAERDLNEAQARLRELVKLPGDQLLDRYRIGYGVDLFGDPNWSRRDNTVAVAKVDDVMFFGVNSDAPAGYTFADRISAMVLREVLVKKYPDVLSTDNIGQFPNDALFHAEATALIRATKAFKGTLEGKTIEIHVDREMCDRCENVLPYLGLELGNPTVTFVDVVGHRTTMRDGSWK